MVTNLEKILQQLKHALKPDEICFSYVDNEYALLLPFTSEENFLEELANTFSEFLKENNINEIKIEKNINKYFIEGIGQESEKISVEIGYNLKLAYIKPNFNSWYDPAAELVKKFGMLLNPNLKETDSEHDVFF